MSGEPDGRCVGVVGAGFMGTGISECAARAGIRTIVHEPEESALERSRGRLERSVARAARAGKMSDPEIEDLKGRLEYTSEVGDLERCDLIVEAVSEDLDVKLGVFGELERVASPRTLLASNTSSIPIAQLASATRHPDRVVGIHFFSPVPMMKLVEIVVAISTSEATVEEASAFAEALGKQPVRTKDRSGFIVNMLLVPYLMAAVRMYEEGFAASEDIDAAMKLGCGHPMGPLALCDLIGLDVLHSVCASLFDEFKRPEYAPPPVLKRMVMAGYTGRKAGRGFYEYEDAAG